MDQSYITRIRERIGLCRICSFLFCIICQFDYFYFILYGEQTSEYEVMTNYSYVIMSQMYCSFWYTFSFILCLWRNFHKNNFINCSLFFSCTTLPAIYTKNLPFRLQKDAKTNSYFRIYKKCCVINKQLYRQNIKLLLRCKEFLEWVLNSFAEIVPPQTDLHINVPYKRRFEVTIDW